MVAVKLLDLMPGSKKIENVISIRVLQWLVIILVDFKIKGIN